MPRVKKGKPSRSELPYTKLRADKPEIFPERFVDEAAREYFEKAQLDLLSAVKKVKAICTAVSKNVDRKRQSGNPLFKDPDSDTQVKRLIRHAFNLANEQEDILGLKICKVTNPVIRN